VTVGAFAGARDDRSGVLWFDAHADLNTPATSPSGFLDGMAAAILLGWCHVGHEGEPDAPADGDASSDGPAASFDIVPGYAPLDTARILFVGARALDPGERDAIARHGIRVLQPDGDDVAAFVEPLDDVYVHLDLDVLDRDLHGPANAFATSGGPSADAVAGVLRAASAHRALAGLTISAYDPDVDSRGSIHAAALRLIEEVLS
jgi:arginase